MIRSCIRVKIANSATIWKKVFFGPRQTM
uniref:Uncharacterized protein n=1 Tax=Anguilla anguilla TaxID=7936 RepID=A0A0E9PY09_ANGAN